MQRDLVRVLSFGFAWVLTMLPGRSGAETPADSTQVSVDTGDGCLNEARLRERVQHYSRGASGGPELRVRVERRQGTFAFHVIRGGQTVARREFQQLPVACDERLDTLALAIAVAPGSAATGEPAADRSAASQQLASGAITKVAMRDPAAADSGRATLDSARSTPPASAQPAATREDNTAELQENDTSDQAGHRASTDTAARIALTPPASAQAAKAMPQRTQAPAPRTEPPSDRGPSPAPPSAAGAPRAYDFSLAAGARIGLQFLPNPVPLFDAGVELGLARTLSLQAAGFASPVVESAADGGKTLTQLIGAELLMCVRPVFGKMLLRTCAGLGAASVAVRGDAFLVDRHARLAWLGGLLRAAVRWPADAPLAAELWLGGQANLIRPRMRVLDSNKPDQVSWPLGGAVGVQLVVVLL